jgi:antitoxin component YwqK of YwqJK toxin-antitoxin module
MEMENQINPVEAQEVQEAQEAQEVQEVQEAHNDGDENDGDENDDEDDGDENDGDEIQEAQPQPQAESQRDPRAPPKSEEKNWDLLFSNLKTDTCLKYKVPKVNEKRHGKFESFEKLNGITWCDQIKYYLDGKIEGECLDFHQNGSVERRTFYKQNKLEGPSQTYYEDGTLQEECFFKDNYFVGQRIIYYQNGNIESNHPYVEGVTGGQEGIRYIYSETENGKITDTLYYLNGEVVEKEKYLEKYPEITETNTPIEQYRQMIQNYEKQKNQQVQPTEPTEPSEPSEQTEAQ